MIIVTTAPSIDGFSVADHLGIVRGIIVRTPNLGQNLLGGLKRILGGQNIYYAEVCARARQDAHDLMMRDAEKLGADAIIALRYDATEFMPGATEVLAYGTAVKLFPKL